MDIILLFCLIIFCNASTEDKYMIKNYGYGKSNSFDFYNEYETYILRGEVQSYYKSLDFDIYSSVNITDIRYLYSNIEYNYPEDMSISLFTNANAKYTSYTYNHEFIFTAQNDLSSKYLYLLISISPSPPRDLTVYVKSTYNNYSSSDSDSDTSTLIITLIIIGVVIIGSILIFAVCGVKNGKTVCEGILACLQCFALCAQLLEACKK